MLYSHKMGVGFTLSSEASASLKEWEPISAQIVMASGVMCLIIQCRAPTNVSTAEGEKENEFYEQLATRHFPIMLALF